MNHKKDGPTAKHHLALDTAHPSGFAKSRRCLGVAVEIACLIGLDATCPFSLAHFLLGVTWCRCDAVRGTQVLYEMGILLCFHRN